MVGVLGSYSKYQFMQLGRVIERVEAAPKRRSTSRNSMPAVRSLNRRLAPEMVEELVTAFESGAEIPMLAHRYGVSKRALRHLLSGQGLQMRKQPLSEGEVELAINLYAEGLSLREIGAQIGRGKTSVRDALIQHGVVLRPAVRQPKIRE